jgi:Spy/CpxP family protein refolding chaperone
MSRSGLKLKVFAAAAALMLGASTLSTSTFSHQGGGGHMGMMGGGGDMGMMGGGGDMGMMGGGGHMMNKYKGLGLSQEQEQQMIDIFHELHKKHWALMGQMIDQQAALQKAYATDRPDPAAVGVVYGQIFDLKRQMIEANLKAKNDAKDVLTEEQLAQMKKMKHQRGGMMQGHGGMMQGHGGMMQCQGGQTN